MSDWLVSSPLTLLGFFYFFHTPPMPPIAPADTMAPLHQLPASESASHHNGLARRKAGRHGSKPQWLARWRSPKLVLSSLNHQINEDLKQIHGISSFLLVFDGLSTKIGENKLGCLLISATKQCGSQCKSPAVQS